MISSLSQFLIDKLVWLFSWHTLVSALGIIFALGLVVIIHELGHFLACRLLDIRVEEFSIGFGKLLKKWGKGETQYSLRAIPLGGYVKPAGEYYAREAEIKDPREFAAKPWYARAFMVFAGAGMNYVLAFVIFFFVIISMGIPQSNPTKIPAVIGEVLENSPAQEYGLKQGDKILAINQNQVENWKELVKEIAATPEGKAVLVKYEQEGQVFTKEIPVGKDKKLGFAVEPVYEQTGPFKAIKVAGYQCYYWTALSLTTIADKLWHHQAPDMAGPIGIFEIVGKGVHSGWEDYFFLIGLISVAIGMFNLFPIPILDGGHIVFFIIEGIRGKRVKESTLAKASSVGAIFLLSLVLYATYSDIMRIKNRSIKPKTQIEQTEQISPEQEISLNEADASN
ncbi:MAG: RIP metalloprotease RseP [Elusimicrobiaceae bacterium]|nr:RIP metalloprotease RseP [Elusimicrobiaceae bacterium]